MRKIIILFGDDQKKKEIFINNLMKEYGISNFCLDNQSTIEYAWRIIKHDEDESFFNSLQTLTERYINTNFVIVANYIWQIPTAILVQAEKKSFFSRQEDISEKSDMISLKIKYMEKFLYRK